MKVWDLDTGRALRTLEGHSNWVDGVAVTADGKRAVSASDDKTLKVWDLDTALLIATFHCEAPANCCAWADAQRIVAGDTGMKRGAPRGSRLISRFNKIPSIQIALRLPEPDVARARELATRKGIGYQTLLKMLVHDGLRREARRA